MRAMTSEATDACKATGRFLAPLGWPDVKQEPPPAALTSGTHVQARQAQSVRFPAK